MPATTVERGRGLENGAGGRGPGAGASVVAGWVGACPFTTHGDRSAAKTKWAVEHRSMQTSYQGPFLAVAEIHRPGAIRPTGFATSAILFSHLCHFQDWYMTCTSAWREAAN